MLLPVPTTLCAMPSADYSLLYHQFFVLLLLPVPSLLCAQYQFYPIANLTTLWPNGSSYVNSISDSPYKSIVRTFLFYSGTDNVTFACGFFGNPTYDAFLLAVYAIYTDKYMLDLDSAQVVWSANRDHLVKENSILNFTADGDLILHDADGSIVWSTNTSGRSVVGMNITQSGNLVLFDQNNMLVWQSFDHPTDVLVLGQNLKEGQTLTANISRTNWTQGQLFLTVLPDTLYAFVNSSPPQSYYRLWAYPGYGEKTIKNSTYVAYRNGSLAVFAKSSTDPGTPDGSTWLPLAASVQFVRLESDGHLRVYEATTVGWQKLYDVLGLNVCEYPTVCGEYGICKDGQCSCPLEADGYLKQVDDRQPNLGCALATPLSCQSMQNHQLLAIDHVSYSVYLDRNVSTLKGTDEESCKQACIANCSCKAALFRYLTINSSDSYCFLLSQLFSLNNDIVPGVYMSTYIKVQINVERPSVGMIVGIILGSLSFFVGVFMIVFLRRKRYEENEEDDFNQVAGMPTRFSFEELKLATENFSKKLGEGGFGSVYEGKMGDERVAVKCLDSIGQGKKEFLAEVETIGSIHHINLARLTGFCVERSHRLLVYEYMCNGSLDKWIFNKSKDADLDWQTRCQIITDTAKGLSYLHEECRQRIAHLDIKPQNILLDDKFNAKISDFGLAKLIDRDQSQVMTRMRGTPGYLAPEWLTSMITEKVDIYSFGVVVLEIIFGRKNLDCSQPEESFHLLRLLQDKIKSDRLLDLFDNHNIDMKLHGQEVNRMIKLAIWCLQSNSNRRPSMSTVVRVLEGAANVETDPDYDIVYAAPIIPRKACNYNYTLDASPPPTSSLLSGPR